MSQDADYSPNALALSGDGHLLAFVGPSKYTVTVMDACNLDEVNGKESPSWEGK